MVCRWTATFISNPLSWGLSQGLNCIMQKQPIWGVPANHGIRIKDLLQFLQFSAVCQWKEEKNSLWSLSTVLWSQWETHVTFRGSRQYVIFLQQHWTSCVSVSENISSCCKVQHPPISSLLPPPYLLLSFLLTVWVLLKSPVSPSGTHRSFPNIQFSALCLIKSIGRAHSRNGEKVLQALHLSPLREGFGWGESGSSHRQLWWKSKRNRKVPKCWMGVVLLHGVSSHKHPWFITVWIKKAIKFP